jgi:hypothetical protein
MTKSALFELFPSINNTFYLPPPPHIALFFGEKEENNKKTKFYAQYRGSCTVLHNLCHLMEHCIDHFKRPMTGTYKHLVYRFIVKLLLVQLL